MLKKIMTIIFFCIFIHSFLYHANGATIRRFALVVGANDGGPGREELRYAVSDANIFLSVLNEMGGVNRDDSELLFEPDRRVFRSALSKLYQKVKKIKPEHRRIEFIFYYSGHSDGQGILLGNEKINYKEIREAIQKIPADVRIAILDSCSSGAFTRAKGGKKRVPFLMDSSYDMKGYAFMTSSSSDEASQESDKIKGSFFTYFLVTGLRGAADMTQDGRITLNEAYQFAFNETLSRTEKTMSGPQHPNYNIQMAGTGDVIITDVRESSAGLILNRSIYGKFIIRDTDSILIAELTKPFGRDIEIGLSGGKYTVINIRDGKLYEAETEVDDGSRVTLRTGSFQMEGKEETRARGDYKTKQDTDKNEGKFLVNNFLELRHSGYGAPLVRLSPIDGKNSILVGGQGGWIIDDRFVLGIGGCGLVTRHEKENLDIEPKVDTLYLQMGYGGLFLEYYLFPQNIFQIAFGILIGAGGYALTENLGDKNDKDEDYENADHSEAFFLAEPQINLYVNITRFLRIGIGATYRFVYGINNYGYSDSDFRNFSGQIVLAFGWF